MASAITWSVKTTSFLDRPAARKALTDFERLWLMRMGSFTRTAARQSIRRRKAISKPGSPPTNRTGVLRNSILFGLATGGKSVVIGPSADFQKSRTTPDKQGAQLLEFGGIVRREYTGRKAIFRNGRLIKPGQKMVMNYRPRPYMAPALVKMAVDLQKKYPTELPKMFSIATAGL